MDPGLIGGVSWGGGGEGGRPGGVGDAGEA